ncbi:MAG: sulfatase-like hydrolase/transferase [Planctomycetales bacterium]|nr:sulfatase-like hydrolase/transferase [Planctomycetales bacterium]
MKQRGNVMHCARSRLRQSLWPLVLLALVTGVSSAQEPDAKPKRPNVVFILTDNHGAWTLGCYGNPDIRTPNLDRMAAEGMRFSRAMSSNPVCSPTRATYLTGLLPSQHGVHSFLDNKYMIGPEARYVLREFETLPEILHSEGYTCGLSGKWHLGANLTPQDGFSYWVTMPRGSTSNMYTDEIIEDGQIKPTPKYMTDLWTDHAVKFIEQSKDSERPFFLYLAYNGPYCLGPLLLRPAQNRHAEYYADKPLLSFPRDSMHPWQYNNKAYHNNPVSIRRVAAEVSAVDDGVGVVLDTLRRHGLERDTIVVFAGDQGWMGGQNGLFGMGDHTRPLGAHDLMMHVPFIFWQPGAVAQGVSDLMVANYDFLPTLLEHLGLRNRIPQWPQDSEAGGPKRPLPGRSFAKALVGESIPWETEVLYEMEGCRALRTEQWKYVERRSPAGPTELYDMQHDPHERFNLAGQPEHQRTLRELRERLSTSFAKHADPQYDIWNGGRSKARRLYAPEGHPDYRPLTE